MSDFKWRPFEGEITLWGVRCYCRYGISYRDLQQMMGERGVSVDPSTIYRWVQKYDPEIESDCAGSGVARSRRVGGLMRPTLRFAETGPICIGRSTRRQYD
jgi:transposase-like protein